MADEIQSIGEGGVFSDSEIRTNYHTHDGVNSPLIDAEANALGAAGEEGDIQWNEGGRISSDTDLKWVESVGVASILQVTGNISLVNGQLSFDSGLSDDSMSGETAEFTAGENLARGDAVYRKSDGKMWKADADSITTAPCIALAAEVISANATGTFLMRGFVRDDSAYAWTVGAIVYLSVTAGACEETIPSGANDVIQVLGVALTADVWYFSPSLTLVEHV